MKWCDDWENISWNYHAFELLYRQDRRFQICRDWFSFGSLNWVFETYKSWPEFRKHSIAHDIVQDKYSVQIKANMFTRLITFYRKHEILYVEKWRFFLKIWQKFSCYIRFKISTTYTVYRFLYHGLVYNQRLIDAALLIATIIFTATSWSWISCPWLVSP